MGFTPEVGTSGFWGGQNDSTIIANDCADCRFMNKIFCMLLLESVGIGGGASAGITGSLGVTGISPNPASDFLSITMQVPGNQADVAVFDLSGRRVATVDTQGLQAGENVIGWAVPGSLSDGVYLLKAVSGSEVAVSRFTLLRSR
jgi:hypothetical protein